MEGNRAGAKSTSRRSTTTEEERDDGRTKAASSDNLWVNASSSAAAGIVGRICTHPLDTVKARLQAPRPPPSSIAAPHYDRGPIDALIRTARSEGLGGLYRGFGAVIVGGTPGTVLYLCTYDVAKRQLANLRQGGPSDDSPRNAADDDDFVVHFGSGMIAETVACIVYVPVDVVKERMQVQHRSAVHGAADVGTMHYKNSWDALQVISRTEGLRGVYKGYAATLASFGPFSALYFVFYERFKLWSREVFELPSGSNDLPFQAILLSSASAGALSSWITSPLDMAKLRLQVNRGRLAANATTPLSPTTTNPPPPASYRGVLHCLRDAYQTSGVRGLFRGAGARVLHFTPATTITMTSYETCRSHILNLLDTGP